MDNLVREIMSSVETGLIDANHLSAEELRPKLIYNDTKKGNTVLANIEKELKHCDSFWFSVAFITKSGLIVLKDTLKELENKGVQGKILTTNYLSFNEPDALRELLGFSNLEVKVYLEENFHIKGFMFQKNELHNFVVGSSNLTQGALKANKEWNLRVSSLNKGELINETNLEFSSMWDSALPLSEEWIKEYEEEYKERKRVQVKHKVERLRTYTLKPNSMQKEATKALANLRAEAKNKAILISATGTGKTYLSAFDVFNVKPKKMLFLVHREQILNQAVESFKDVLGNHIKTGKLSGKHNDYDADFLFATTSMMAKESVFTKFAFDHFDYIIVDEAHRAGSEGYLRFLNYFKPQFLLGMTATPERTDGFDVYELFDHNIAYEIRLQRAMEEKLLCPFHYFGITELSIDGNEIDDSDYKKVFTHLISDERINNIIDKIKFYGFSGSRVKGLIFCRSVEEAELLSIKFNEKGYRTEALSGKDSQQTRDEAIDKLGSDDKENRLDYILTKDIFNEGVDIPFVNQIIMLRPTESSIVFVQQLGRGLRKSDDKEYVVILDFIGNYNNNFMIPLALSGDRTYNKDTLRKYVLEGNKIIPGCSTIHFDEISRDKIFRAIDNISGIRKYIRTGYQNLKFKLGRVPTLVDFYVNGEIDPLIILNQYKTYFAFLQTEEEKYRDVMLESELMTLEYLSKVIVKGHRPYELLILNELITHGTLDISHIKLQLKQKYNLMGKEKDIDSAIVVLNGGFVSNASEKLKYQHLDILKQNKQGFYERMASFHERLNKNEFRLQLIDLVTLGLNRYNDIYYNHDSRSEFVLYEKYSRRDICFLLNWGKDLSSTMYGMKRVEDDVALFVTYNKETSNDESAYVKGKPDYEDEFMPNSRQYFMWSSQIGKGPNSNYMKDVCEPRRKHLFIKKSDAEGTDFYYMGTFDVVDVKGDKKQNTNGREQEISKVKLKLHDAVREDIVDYLECGS